MRRQDLVGLGVPVGLMYTVAQESVLRQKYSRGWIEEARYDR